VYGKLASLSLLTLQRLDCVVKFWSTHRDFFFAILLFINWQKTQKKEPKKRTEHKCLSSKPLQVRALPNQSGCEKTAGPIPQNDIFPASQYVLKMFGIPAVIGALAVW